MKKGITILILAALLGVTPVLAQQEKGDVEVQFLGSIFSTVGAEDVTFTAGNIQAKLGYFLTDRFEVGGYPSLTISTLFLSGGTETETTFGLGAFAVYSFLSNGATTVPYVGAQYVQLDVSSESQGNAGINGGIKFFLNRYAAFDVSGNYLFSLDEGGSGLVLMQVGLSFLL